MKITLLFFALFVVASQPAHADSALMGIGGKFGVNFGTWARSGDMPSVFERTYTPGITGGAYLHLRRWTPVSPQFEILFTHKGTELEIDGASQGQFDLYYMDMLILARAELPVKPVILFALAGPEASVLLSSTFTSPGGVTNDEDGYQRFDAGVVAGAGVAFGPLSWGTLTLEARYGMGFINVNPALDDVNVTLKNRTISITLGYEYRRAQGRE